MCAAISSASQCHGNSPMHCGFVRSTECFPQLHYLAPSRCAHQLNEKFAHICHVLPIISYFRKYSDATNAHRLHFLCGRWTDMVHVTSMRSVKRLAIYPIFMLLFGASLLAASTQTFETISSAAYLCMDSDLPAKGVCVKR